MASHCGIFAIYNHFQIKINHILIHFVLIKKKCFQIFNFCSHGQRSNELFVSLVICCHIFHLFLQDDHVNENKLSRDDLWEEEI
jgi:hypothetical protein